MYDVLNGEQQEVFMHLWDAFNNAISSLLLLKAVQDVKTPRAAVLAGEVYNLDPGNDVAFYKK